MLLLRRRGLEVSALDYLRVGLIVTPGLLIVAVLATWATLAALR